MSKWKIYDPLEKGKRGTGKVKLPPPPPWRRSGRQRREVIARTFQATAPVIDAVNIALHLRRPLLVTGRPGTGKSSLIYSVAEQLSLGEVIVWAINSRSTLSESLYRYDALARLQHIQEMRALGSEAPHSNPKTAGASAVTDDVGEFITLGPLGAALADRNAPRALLIDEIDKSDVDLPNDLLNVLDTGSFAIAELQRIAGSRSAVNVRTVEGETMAVTNGVVNFSEYPFIVMTSNGERDFPAPFLRRCVQCDLPAPDDIQLGKIIKAHFAELKNDEDMRLLIKAFLAEGSRRPLATDQLLNAQHLAPTIGGQLTNPEHKELLAILFKSLD